MPQAVGGISNHPTLTPSPTLRRKTKKKNLFRHRWATHATHSPLKRHHSISHTPSHTLHLTHSISHTPSHTLHLTHPTGSLTCNYLSQEVMVFFPDGRIRVFDSYGPSCFERYVPRDVNFGFWMGLCLARDVEKEGGSRAERGTFDGCAGKLAGLDFVRVGDEMECWLIDEMRVLVGWWWCCGGVGRVE